MDIGEAIKSRSIIEFVYEGHPRTVVPAAYGHHVTTRNLVLRGYQVGGTRTSGGVVPHWSLFRVDKMGSVSASGEKFIDDPPDYIRGDKDISPLIQEL